ncbi:MAG: hypothetical protein H5T80_15350 [Dietzia sp.]|nr:hypothetical protein [Dietzia sp.]
MSAAFTALYRSQCAVCDETILPGHDVTWVDDDLVHLECADIARVAHHRTERPVPVCETCHLTKPCDCEDHR